MEAKTMDRELDRKERRVIWIRRAVLIGLTLTVVGLAVMWGGAWLNPSLSRSQIQTARVEFGSIETGITASGVVVPEMNQALSSPIDARVIHIMKRPGDLLTPDESILELDVRESRLSLDKIQQNLALKRNQQAKAKIDLEHTLFDLKSRCQIQELELQSNQNRLVRNKELHQNGLISADEIRRLEIELAKARIELEQLLESKRNAEISARTQEDGLAMELAMLEKEEKAIGQELELATTKADRKGVLTWVVTEEGTMVRKGEVIARLADLGSFRVEAKISDVHANRLSIGLPVQVRINDNESLTGSISQVLPSIENGVVAFKIALEQKSYKGLHSNLRVDVDVFTDRKAHALRIKKGPAILGANMSELFVIRGLKAVRTPVHLGMAGLSEFEVLDGLVAGDEVVLSDMTEYANLKEIPIKK
jgi:HlyD family secretion protein